MTGAMAPAAARTPRRSRAAAGRAARPARRGAAATIGAKRSKTIGAKRQNTAAASSSAAAAASEGTFEDFVLATQADICAQAAAADGGAAFCEDRWERAEGSGFGVTRVLEGGRLFEKAACNVSVIGGVLSAERAAAMSARGRPGVDPRGGQQYAVRNN